MGSSNASLLTAPLLALYSQAALRNADELLVEAKLLYDHGHYARAYFLAFGCIEPALFAEPARRRAGGGLKPFLPASGHQLVADESYASRFG